MSRTLELTVNRELFYNDENNFGIYGCTPSDDDIPFVKLNKYGNITIKGVMQRLEIYRTYKVKAVEVEDKKFGFGYNVERIVNDAPTSIEEQKTYLKSLLTETQVNSIYEVYEGQDVIKMMQDNTFDHSKVKGIGDYTYNNIREKIIINLELQSALVELSQYGLNYNNISKLVKHYNNSPALLIEKVKENPYVLTDVNGIGFIKCDQYALKMGIEKESSHRINACIEYILDEAATSEGHSWVGKVAVYKKAVELLDIDKKIVRDSIENLSPTKFHVDEKRVALFSNYWYEKQISEKLNLLINSFSHIEVEDIDSKINDAEKVQGFEFTDEQRRAIRMACEEQILIVNGKAGTGKTSVLKGVLSVLGEYTYMTCALSGKASQRIVESTGLQSMTIHRLLSYTPREGFHYRNDNPLKQDIIVVDEASMVNVSIFFHLLDAIKRGSKLIILGDTEQLEPIGCGNVLKNMIESCKIPTVTLTVVHRQALKSGILSVANKVRDGIQFTESNNYNRRRIGELKDLFLRPFADSEDVYTDVIDVCKKYEGDIMDFQVIVPLKARGLISTKNLNVELQKIFNPDDKPTISRNGFDFKEGDKVIQQGNNYEDDVFNGTLGTIMEVNTEDKFVTIDFVGGNELVQYKQEDMMQIDLAYALSVHRCQGSQFKVVLFAIDFSAYVLLSRQLVYTALTRASHSLILICENEALRKAVGIDKASKRNTFLSELLQAV